MGRDNDNYINGTVDDVSCLFVCFDVFVCVSNSQKTVLDFLSASKWLSFAHVNTRKRL